MIAAKLYRRHKSFQVLAAISLVCLVSGICFPFSGLIGYKVVAFILLLTVSFIAMFFNIVPVLVAALLSSLIWNFLFIPPRFTFRVSNAEDSLMLLMYFIIACINAALTFKIRQVEKRARLKAEKERTIGLYNTLLNSLSHELRTPIATIIGASDNLLSDTGNYSELHKKQMLAEISSASLRLNRQVENLLNMSRLESGQLQLKKDWCDIIELLHGTINSMEEDLAMHRVSVSAAEELPLFKIDAGLMQQALHNLISNAVLYTPESSLILIGASLQGKYLTIYVSDNGPGFPEAETEKVFGKFYRLQHSRTGGTGLGLSIVKGIVEAHNGSIQLSNKDEGGAVFTMQIPAETSYIKNLKHE